MYAELDLLFSYSQGFSFSPEVQSFCSFQRPSSMNYPVQTTVSEYDLGGEGDLFKAPQPVLEEPVGLEPMTLISMIPDDQRITRQTIKTSTLSEYDVGGDGDLFKAPEPITEEPMLGYDPMAAISMTSCGEDAITAPMIKAANIESFQGEQLLDEVFYECKKDLVAKSVIDDSLSEVLDVKNPAIRIEEDLTVERGGFITGGLMQKSFSSGSLSSMEWTTGRATRPSFLDFPATDFGAALGMRRAFSEGDMQILATGNVPGRSPISQLLNTGSYTPEERKLRLSRYRIKKAKRNFGRKIKYACRKALADSQPRVRGRFAKTEEVWDSNYSKQDGCKYSTARQVEGSSQTSSYGTVGEITRIENPFERLHGSISGSCHYQELAAIGPYFLQR